MPSMLEPEQDGHIDALIDVLIAIARRILRPCYNRPIIRPLPERICMRYNCCRVNS